jgi:hypothetical protein
MARGRKPSRDERRPEQTPLGPPQPNSQQKLNCRHRVHCRAARSPTTDNADFDQRISGDLAAEFGSAPRAIRRLTSGRNRKMRRPADQQRMSVEETLLRVFKPNRTLMLSAARSKGVMLAAIPTPTMSLTATTSRSQKQEGQAAKLSRSIQTNTGFCAK